MDPKLTMSCHISYSRVNDSNGKLQLMLCAHCSNHAVCSCHKVKKNQAKSEYERELINFVNPSDYLEKIPRKKLCISKDFSTTRAHRLGTSSVRVMKDAGMKGVTKDIPATITSRNDNATTTDVQPTIDTSSSIVCHIKKNCNQ